MRILLAVVVLAMIVETVISVVPHLRTIRLTQELAVSSTVALQELAKQEPQILRRHQNRILDGLDQYSRQVTDSNDDMARLLAQMGHGAPEILLEVRLRSSLREPSDRALLILGRPDLLLPAAEVRSLRRLPSVVSGGTRYAMLGFDEVSVDGDTCIHIEAGPDGDRVRMLWYPLLPGTRTVVDLGDVALEAAKAPTTEEVWSAELPIALDHTYVGRDLDPAVKLIVAFRVLSHVPGSMVTIRWRILSPVKGTQDNEINTSTATSSRQR